MGDTEYICVCCASTEVVVRINLVHARYITCQHSVLNVVLNVVLNKQKKMLCDVL